MMLFGSFWGRFGKERTRSWQEFLSRTYELGTPPKLESEAPPGTQPLYTGKTDGNGSNELTRATRRFQQLAGIPESGEVDEDTTHAAMRMPQWTRVWLSPRTDAPDIRHLRPYFAVPLDDTAFPGERSFIQRQIERRFEETYASGTQAMVGAAPETFGQVTDVFVLSHGWHRNYFSGVAAYDRLVSRLSVLASRGNISLPEGFSPIFIGLHWHSDPGENGWLDKAGRRSKDSFMRNVRELFTWEGAADEHGVPLTEAAFVYDFERIFEFMSCISAPDVQTMDPDFDRQSKYLGKLLVQYNIRGRQGVAAHDEKVAMVWRCYTESDVKTLVADQADKARPVGTFWDSLRALSKFVVGILGIMAVVNYVIKPLLSRPAEPPTTPVDTRNGLEKLWDYLTSLPWLNPLERSFTPDAALWADIGKWFLIVFGGAVVVLGLYAYIRKASRMRDCASKGIPLLPTLAYLVMQLVCALPVLYFVLITFLFRTWLVLLAPIAWALGYPVIAIYLVLVGIIWSFLAAHADLPLLGVFSERPGDFTDNAAKVRNWLAALGRWPINWLRASVGKDSRVLAMAEGLDNQFAFFEMQRKGASAGDSAGAFLDEVLRTVNGVVADFDPEARIRVHLMGHSFGGLVVANALRTMTTKGTFAAAPRFEMRTFCLVQAAISSSWFRHEPESVAAVQGGLGCVFSGYDSANGFWYPAANQARLAAGYVGLCKIQNAFGPPVELGKDGQFAMLVRPPKLKGSAMRETYNRDPANPQRSAPYLLNLDASRIIYEGPIATGGGHGDIFKDDVVNLLWAVSQL